MNQKTKDIIKKTWLFKLYLKYTEFRGRHHRQEVNAFFREEGPELLQYFAKTLNESNLIFWLEFGTLLGYYREHDFIPHDDDLDVGAKIEDQPKINQALIKAGFELVRHFYSEKDGIIEECYRYKHTLIDIFYFFKKDNTLYAYIPQPYINSFIPKHYGPKDKRPYKLWKISVADGGYEKAEFKGAMVWIPNEIQSYLSAHYGPGFMTPDPKFSRLDVATNITILTYEENPAYAYLTI